jgi:hypothetical protein
VRLCPRGDTLHTHTAPVCSLTAPAAGAREAHEDRQPLVRCPDVRYRARHLV